MSVPEGRAITVLHGDYRLDNLFFDDSRNVTVLDWQLVTKGVAGYDFVYFVSQSLSAADRRSYLDDLVDTYLRTLAESDVTYPEDQFWDRCATVALVLPLVSGAGDGARPHGTTRGGARQGDGRPGR